MNTDNSKNDELQVGVITQTHGIRGVCPSDDLYIHSLIILG